MMGVKQSNTSHTILKIKLTRKKIADQLLSSLLEYKFHKGVDLAFLTMVSPARRVFDKFVMNE